MTIQRTINRRLRRQALALAALIGSFSLVSCAEVGGDSATEVELAKQVQGLDGSLPANAAGGSAFIEITLAHLAAVAITPEWGPDNDRDEVFMMVNGKSDHDAVDVLLPMHQSDLDYYEFKMGDVRKDDSSTGAWTNEDQADVGPPLIWNGRLWPTQKVSLIVTLLEKEFTGSTGLRGLVSAGCAALGGVEHPAAKAGALACKEGLPLLPTTTEHEVIGAFAVSVENINGEIKTSISPVASGTRVDYGIGQGFQWIQAQGKRQVDDLAFNGSGQYRVMPVVKLVEQLRPRLRYIDDTEDNCGEAEFRVHDASVVEADPQHFIDVPRGGFGELPLRDYRFAWECGYDDERTVCPGGTDHLRLRRDNDGDEIQWWCFKREPFNNDGLAPPVDPNTQKLTLKRWITQQGYYSPNARFLAGDFNGDAYTDIAKIDGAQVEVYRSVGGSFVFDQNVAWNVWQGTPRFLTGDFNGDGRSDIAAVEVRLDNGGGSNLKVMLSNGSRFAAPISWLGTSSMVLGGAEWLTGDYDGDGRDDIARIALPSNGAILLALSKGDRFEAFTPGGSRYGHWVGQKFVSGDFDGNGKADIGYVWNDNWTATIDAYLSGGSYFEPHVFAIRQTSFWDQQKWFAGDFDDNGKTDFGKAFGDFNGQFNEISMDVHLSDGSWLSPYRWETRQGGYGDQQQYLSGDFNGDGSPDVAMVGDINGAVTIDVHQSRPLGTEVYREFGNLRDVGVSPDGTVWGIGTAGLNVATSDSTIFKQELGKWKALPSGAAQRIDGGPEGPWVTTSQKDLFKYENGAWVLQPDIKANDVGVAADGTVWVVSNEAQWGGYRIYRKRPGGSFEYMQAAGVAVDAGAAGSGWMVNEYNQIYSYVEGRGWLQTGGEAKDVTISPEGTVYVVGLAPRAHGGTVYRREGDAWELVQTYGAKTISAGPRNQLVITTKEGEAFSRWADPHPRENQVDNPNLPPLDDILGRSAGSSSGSSSGGTRRPVDRSQLPQ